MIYAFDDAEALRLLRAFYRIGDPDARRTIVAITEASAHGAEARLEQSGEESVQTDRLTS